MTSLPGNWLKLEFDRDVVNDVSGMVQYYMAMRVLMHAWAWAGSYQTKDYDGVDRTMATLSQCLGYADEALRLCAEYGSSSVSWLHRNDTMTRGKVSSLVRRGYTAGSALMQAMRQSHIEWRSPVHPLDLHLRNVSDLSLRPRLWPPLQNERGW